jgi:VIT1/CCC1 family predicted Fe2+/Mn2+ transporter
MEDADRSRLVDEAKSRLQRAARIANTAGALDLFFFALLLFPVAQPVDRTKVIIINTIAFVVLLVGTYWFGDRIGSRNTERTRAWLADGRDPTPEERDYALRLPVIQARLSGSLWLFAAVAFSLLNLVVAPQVFWVIPIVIVLGGITTSILYYLLAERILRPIAVCALRGGLPEQPARPGVRGKLTLVWLGATGARARRGGRARRRGEGRRRQRDRAAPGRLQPHGRRPARARAAARPVRPPRRARTSRARRSSGDVELGGEVREAACCSST